MHLLRANKGCEGGEEAGKAERRSRCGDTVICAKVAGEKTLRRGDPVSLVCFSCYRSVLVLLIF